MKKIEGSHKAFGNTIHRVVGESGQKVGHITQTRWGFFVPVKYRNHPMANGFQWMDQLPSKPSLAEALESLTNS